MPEPALQAAGRHECDAIIALDGVVKTYAKSAGAGSHTALRDINLTIARGETVGLIGDNGAGKSTLLRLIAGITAPSAGRIRVSGSVASLLSMGAGFHPELSGRDNVRFKAALLGIRRRELRRRMAEIVEFAAVGKFIDQPLRVYSTGMQSRLAFAIATCLDAEIIVIDEALSVGDIAFRERAIGRIRELTGREGRTVLLASHVMQTVLETADRALWLEHGELQQLGPQGEVVQAYVTARAQRAQPAWHAAPSSQTRPSTHTAAQPLRLQLTHDGAALETPFVRRADALSVICEFATGAPPGARFGISLFDPFGNRLWRSLQHSDSGAVRLPLRLELLHPGQYSVKADAETAAGGSLVDPFTTIAQVRFVLEGSLEFDLGRHGLIRLDD